MGQEGSFHLSTKSRGEESRAYLRNGTLWGVYKEAGTVRPEGTTPRKGCGRGATVRSASSKAGGMGVAEMRRGWGREASGEAMTSSYRECPRTEKRAMGSQKDEETRRRRIHGNLETGWM